MMLSLSQFVHKVFRSTTTESRMTRLCVLGGYVSLSAMAERRGAAQLNTFGHMAPAVTPLVTLHLFNAECDSVVVNNLRQGYSHMDNSL